MSDDAGQRPNVGAAARDHLANERTFLAWFRTGAAATGLGGATPRLAGNSHAQTWAAAVLVALFGVAILGYGLWRFRQTESALAAGRTSVDARGPAVLVGAAIVIGAACAVLIAT